MMNDGLAAGFRFVCCPLPSSTDVNLMNFMKLVIPLHEKDSKRCRDTRTPESIHTKDESKRGSAFAFIFGVN